MITSILIPTDFSPASWKATQVGLEFARLNEKTKLSILHIYPSEPSKEGLAVASDFPKMDQLKTRMIKLAADLVDHSEERIDNVVLSGNVEQTMLDFIQENDFDLVIVGINSNGFDNIPGSHTLRVIEKSGTPVMIVPNTVSADGSIAS